MVSILSSRNLIYWWVFLTSFVFLQTPARELARNFRDNKAFSSSSFPFSLAAGLTSWIDDRAKQIVATFQFNPSAVVIQVQGVVILDGFRIGVLLILVLLVLAVRFYTRAVASPRIYDDILALVVTFFVYHLVAQTLKAIKLAPNAQGLTLGDQMIVQRSTWVWFLAIVIVAMVVGGKGWMDAKVFWKGIIELFFVWLFLIPEEAARSFAALLELLAGFGSVLTQTSNVSWALLWALIGMLLAAYRLYNAQPPGAGAKAAAAKSAGGGGGGASAKSAGGGGGILSRLGGGRG